MGGFPAALMARWAVPAAVFVTLALAAVACGGGAAAPDVSDGPSSEASAGDQRFVDQARRGHSTVCEWR